MLRDLPLMIDWKIDFSSCFCRKSLIEDSEMFQPVEHFLMSFLLMLCLLSIGMPLPSLSSPNSMWIESASALCSDTEFEEPFQTILNVVYLLWIYVDQTLFLLQKDEVYLNLVLEYIPETVYKVARQYAKNKQTIPINFIRVSSGELTLKSAFCFHFLSN